MEEQGNNKILIKESIPLKNKLNYKNVISFQKFNENEKTFLKKYLNDDNHFTLNLTTFQIILTDCITHEVKRYKRK